MASKRKKLKTAEQIADQRAKEIGVPAIQGGRLEFRLASVSNRTDADQRHMVRSGDTQTVRRLTRIEKLHKAGTIQRDEAAACEWYAEQHALGYDTIGCTANYAGAGGGGFRPHDLLARYKAQHEARENYVFARAALPAGLVALFEGVVLHGKPLVTWANDERGGRSQRATRLASAFRLAVRALNQRIGHLVPAE